MHLDLLRISLLDWYALNGRHWIPWKIKQDGKNVGELRSISGNLGIAIIRLEALEKDVSLKAGDAFIIPKKPEWANF